MTWQSIYKVLTRWERKDALVRVPLVNARLLHFIARIITHGDFTIHAITQVRLADH